MIEQEKSGLTQSHYDGARDPSNPSEWKIVAHRYNLKFTREGQRFSNGNQTNAFDATYHNGKVIWLHQTEVYIQTGLDQNSRVSTDLPAENVAEQPGLIVDSGNVYIYILTGSSLNRYTLTINGDNTATFSSPEIVTNSVANIKFIAPVSANKVHCLYYNPSTLLYRLSYFEYSTSWQEELSQIHWQHPVQTFDAVSSPSGFDSIVMATQMPGLVKTTVVSGTVVRQYEPSGGVVVFKQENADWSDHFEIDVLDNISNWKKRSSVKITYLNDRLIITAWSLNGSRLFPIAVHRMYTSKDGIHWSNGSVMTIPSRDLQAGICLDADGDYVYGMGSHSLYRSLSTDAIGYSSPAVQEDISNYVLEYQYSQGEVSSASITLDNSTSYFYEHPIFNRNNVIMLEHYSGRWFDGAPRLIRIGITEVDTIEEDFNPTSKTIKVTSRDRFMWMTDYTQSEDGRYWESQVVSADTYDDDTQTGYGGLSHTATQSGTWQTENGSLYLKTANQEGISFSTHQTYLWNGSYQIQFTLSRLQNDEFAGIIIRAVDRNNCLMAVYNQSLDVVQLIERNNGVDTVQATSGNLTWDNTLGPHKLMVRMHYARIEVFAAAIGSIWSRIIDWYQPGMPVGQSDAFLDRGYAGQIAKGYAPQTVYQASDFELGDIIIPDLNFDWDLGITEPTVELPYDPGINIGSNTYDVFAIDSFRFVYTTNNFQDAEPAWQSDLLWNFASIPQGYDYGYIRQVVYDNKASVPSCYIRSDSGVVYLYDIFNRDTGPTISQLFTYSPAAYDPNSAARFARTFTLGLNDWMAITWRTSTGDYFAYSVDGTTWSTPTQVHNVAPSNWFGNYAATLHLDYYVPGKAYVSVPLQENNQAYAVKVTTDYGATWNFWDPYSFDGPNGENTGGYVHFNAAPTPMFFPYLTSNQYFFGEWFSNGYPFGAQGRRTGLYTKGQEPTWMDMYTPDFYTYGLTDYNDSVASKQSNPNHIIAIGWDQRAWNDPDWEIMRSFDKGATWELTSMKETTTGLENLSPKNIYANEQYIIVVGSNGKFALSSDFGTTHRVVSVLTNLTALSGSHGAGNMIGLIGG